MLLRKFDFGNEAGDDATEEELASYFVEKYDFSKYTDPKKRLLITTAKKGMGKSALIKRLHHVIKKENRKSLTIRCRGSDLSRSSFKLRENPETPNEYIRDWTIRICTLINREIAKTINFATTNDEISIVESAEIDGYKEKNLIRCLIDRFGGILGKYCPKTMEPNNPHEALKRLQFENVYLLIDDLDATFQNTKTELLSLSTFFSACRYLTQDMKGISFRATMRSDVWPIIRRFDESLDKLEQYINELKWTSDEFRTLLFKRILSQIEENSFKAPEKKSNESSDAYECRVLDLLFSKEMMWGKKYVKSYSIIYTLSYGRPRWAIQLCKSAQISANKMGRNVITKEDIDSVWGEYGKKRIADLVAEHKHQCDRIEEVVTAFRGENRLFTRDELTLVINNKILNHLPLWIDSKKPGSPLDVASFLYRIGFLVARSEEKDGHYEHYHFDDMPDFLSSRTDNDFNVKWEVHPCYREALDIRKINRSRRKARGIC